MFYHFQNVRRSLIHIYDMQPSTTSKYKGSVLRKHQEQQVLPDELIAKKQSASRDKSIRFWALQ